MEPTGENAPKPIEKRPAIHPKIKETKPKEDVGAHTPLNIGKTMEQHDTTAMSSIRDRLRGLFSKGESEKPKETTEGGKLDAIVVLSGDWKKLKKNGDRASTESRLRAIAVGELYRAGVSDNIIITGGVADSQSRTIAEEMQRYLLTHFKDIPVEAVVLEEAARSTRENAQKVKEMLDRTGVQNIGVLTSRTHLKRAERIFRHFGMNVEQEFIAEDIVKERKNSKGELSERHARFIQDYESKSPSVKSGKKRELFLKITRALGDKGDRVGHAFATMNRTRAIPNPPAPKK
jgi:uncharacterized SAM-binding protein YcdF (DUF218 family)